MKLTGKELVIVSIALKELYKLDILTDESKKILKKLDLEILLERVKGLDKEK